MSLEKHADGEDATDLGALWTQAVEAYQKKTGLDLKLDNVRTMQDVMNATEGQMKKFGGFRNSETKVGKVRHAFGSQIGNMQKVMNGIQMVGQAASAFPPAMPVGIVFAACGHLLNVSVRDDSGYEISR
jgi:hypothetical protein